MLSGLSSSSQSPPAPSPFPYDAPSWDHAALFNHAYSQQGLPHSRADWIHNSSAATHVTGHPGNLSSFLSLPKHFSSHIVVGNGDRLPITGVGSTTLPPPNLSLNDVLVCPNIVKDLISVRKLSCDNHVAVEFNPNGFSVKALPTRTPLMTS